MDSKNYYIDKTGVIKIKKGEVINSIDVYDLATVRKWCKVFNIPLVYDIWFKVLTTTTKHNIPESRAFGRYLATMKLFGYRGYSYEASDFINDRMVVNDYVQSTRDKEQTYNRTDI